MKFKKTVSLGLGALMAMGMSLSNLSCVLADNYNDALLKAVISEQEAKNIMYNKVPGATIVDFELSKDDGVLKYEGELVKGQIEYEIDVDAKTGKIIQFEKESIDLYDDDDDDAITTSGVNVRSGASTSYAKIGYLAKGTKIDIEKKMSNGWYKIEYKGGVGYVSGKYVKLLENDDLYDDDDDDGITTSGVNVRSGASTSYAKIGYLPKGTKVDIEKKMSNGWYKIEYKDGIGYVSGKYIKVF